MSEPSGPNSRVIEVLNFLAAHPTESFTLSELAGHLGLSNGSAHRVLTTLTEARYLSRHPKHKTYALGMALVAIGQAALEQHRGIDIARREMARLADEFRAQCIATAQVEDDLLFLAKEGVPQTHDGLSRVGERRPFVPPLGLGHIAWASPDRLESYLARSPEGQRERMRGYLDRALPLIRRRGFVIAANGDAVRTLRQTSTLPLDQQRDAAYWARVHDLVDGLSAREIQLDSLDEIGPEGISYISVPVFTPDGTVGFELTLSGMAPQLDRPGIEQCIARLRAAAAVVTAEIHGRMPVG